MSTILRNWCQNRLNRKSSQFIVKSITPAEGVLFFISLKHEIAYSQVFEYSNTSVAEYSNPFFPTNPSPSCKHCNRETAPRLMAEMPLCVKDMHSSVWFEDYMYFNVNNNETLDKWTRHWRRLTTGGLWFMEVLYSHKFTTRQCGNYSDVLPLKATRCDSISNLTSIGASNLSYRQTQCRFI